MNFPRRSYLKTVIACTMLVGSTVFLSFLLLFPKLFTGSYVKATVTSIDIQPSGQTRISIEYSASSGTKIFTSIGGSNYSYAQGGGFVGRPVNGKLAINFSMNRGRSEDLTREEMKSRILVEEGNIYVVKPGSPLVFYRSKDPSGKMVEGVIRASDDVVR